MNFYSLEAFNHILKYIVFQYMKYKTISINI